MKKGLEKSQSNIKDEIRKPFRWAKGFILGGKKVYHPYTLKGN
jgi:hypothetical protein